MTNLKRLFFAFDIDSAWPETLPNRGRIIDVENRHMTLAFLGKVDFVRLEPLLAHIPKPAFTTGLVGKFDQVEFFPEKHPHVVVWRANCFQNQTALIDYQRKLNAWLKECEFQADDSKEFHPHVTVCRGKFYPRQWSEAFSPFPFFLKGLHLFESLGGSKYQSLWKHSLISPIEEVDHTADIAYLIRGKNLQEIFLHAFIALSIEFPFLLEYLNDKERFESVDEVISELNKIITKADTDRGCPFKALSYHGEINRDSNGILHWEMIIDV